MTKVAVATGNFTAAGTWGTVTGYETDSEVAAHLITIAAKTFGAFVPGAITVDRVLVKLQNRVSSPTGTISVAFRNITTSTDIKTVTINVSDIPAPPAIAGNMGWICFKFDAATLLVAGNQYAFKLSSSVNNEVTVYANNAILASASLSAILVTTTTGAPVATEKIHICGEYTAAATNAVYTITMDSTATTAYGTGTTETACGFTINGNGLLSYGTAAATNYVLRVSSVLRVYPGGELRIGISGAEIPRGSTAVLEFPCLADGDYGLYIDGTFTTAGLSRTSGKVFDRCYLNTDEAVAQTVLGVDTDTGWLNGDEMVIASTDRTLSQSDRRTLSGNAGATSITVTSGLTYAHSGTSPTQAEVILLTRNVLIRSTSATLMSYCRCLPTAIVDLSWTQFRYMSSTATNKTAALVITTTTGSVLVDRCSFYDCEAYGILVNSSTANNITIQNCVGSVCNSSSSIYGFFSMFLATSGTNWLLDNNWYIGATAAAGTGILINDFGGSVTNNVVVGVATGMAFAENNVQVSGTISDNVIHTCTTGVSIANNIAAITLSSFTVWRCSTGVTFATCQAINCDFISWILFGSITNMSLTNTNGLMVGCRFTDCEISGDTSFASTWGITLAYMLMQDVEFENCTFGVASGIKTTHSTADFVINGNTVPAIVRTFLNNCTLASSLEFQQQTVLNPLSYIRLQKKDATTTNHSTLLRYGTLALNAAVFKTAAPSLKMTPNNASNKCESAPKNEGWKAAVASGGTITASVYINKNASYNGNQPRLIVRKNYAAGITADTVLATYTSGTGSWNQISGATASVTDDAVLEFIVDCDGTAGYISVDDATFS